MEVALKPQDVLVTLKVAVWPGGAWSFANLSKELDMSASEVHSATRRALASELLVRRADLGMLGVHRRNLLEFLVHGLRYTYPAERGAVTRGVPTAGAAPIMARHLAPTAELPPVWPHPEGAVRGQSFKPLYRSAVSAAARDEKLYGALALVDAIRGGRARERAVATDLLRQLLQDETR